MKKLLIHFVTVSALFFSQAYAQAPYEKAIDDLIKQHLPDAAVGLVIQDPKTGNIIYEARAEESFLPASTTKLFTAVAALKYLGENFQFQTTLQAPLDKISGNVLNDNLYFVFRGDPTFQVKHIQEILKALKTKGVNQIQGNLVIDDSAFAEPYYAQGWTWDSLPWYYSAPITSIIINENKVRLKFNKATALNAPIKVEQADAELPPFKLQTNVIAVSAQDAEHNCQLNVKVKNNDLSLYGCWPIDKTPVVVELAVDDTRAIAKSLIESSLKQLDIKLTGTIQFGPAPKNVPAIIVKRSAPLKALLPRVLADSNNVYAESLTKGLGLAYGGQGTFQAGINAIQEILAEVSRIEFSKMKLSDGSGQSRYNLVSPYLVSQLLNFMYHDPSFPVFQASLSSAGQNGTLATRLKDKATIGKVIGKTGSATGTSALSGYLTTAKGNEYLFSLMINHSTKNYNELKRFEDKLCQLLIDEPWAPTSTTAPKRS
ncbi:D-alanyl-D-alanine carboxypeptidase/D-alanyl-D-alanine endopeptidase [Candidatus Berkiella aquae]|uniref:D-alanyl-D-alanine carboxypeptidase DacB n=1 Tax=Candidatus Berkiella aquae TaxID=295108 RepID=A0A0Q9Z1Z3_9GAMM|nr:D-alanyl-D-alanine carboxypeptidase/D-alanyl-D-alanine-endopeptidase [Candidatus Berkiella aquae]MCS5712120.1 D-alanyl-D-alanine carboxypeptidase/D-alanyl-D-alanine-endopeptidase [Candidatus Berkiella aquae]